MQQDKKVINLKRFRKKFNVTQSAAAAAIGIDQRQWNRYENGKNKIPADYIKEICIKFNVSADWLFELDQERGDTNGTND